MGTAKKPPIVAFIVRELGSLADARKAGEMAAYMKTDQPFFGVSEPRRRPVFRELFERFAPANAREYRANVLALWDAGRASQREIQYAACNYGEHFDEHHTPARLAMFKRMIIQGAWWDHVDHIAMRMVGPIVRGHPAAGVPVMRKWIDDDNLWVRRVAIICQVGHKDQTDADMLFEFCLRRADEKDFFIRKAIGWALRQYAWTNPGAVKKFLVKHKSRLSNLSVREGGKHIGVRP